MHILTMHNRYLFRGGEDESREAEDRMLVARGHSVNELSEDNARVASLGAIRAGLSATWSSEAYWRTRTRLRSRKFDIVDIHNFFPLLSPSVHYAAKAEGVPVVQTLHNFRLLCPNAILFRDGNLCQDCIGRLVPLPGIWHACYRKSRAASLAVATMIVTHRILRTWQRKVDAFVAVSEFEKSILTKAGLPQERIHAKPNFVTPDPGESREPRRDVLFVGRLTAEKGIVTLIQAWKSSRRRCDLVIVGDGPLSPYVTEQAGDSSHIRYLGRRSAKDVYDLMGRSSYVLFPSEWYETFGRVAIEAFAKGTPVIGSDIGAIPEVVHHERTGILFRPGDVGELARSMDWADEHPERLAAMGRDCRNEYEAKYTDVVNYESMMRIYAAATSRNSSICDERTAGREE